MSNTDGPFQNSHLPKAILDGNAGPVSATRPVAVSRSFGMPATVTSRTGNALLSQLSSSPSVRALARDSTAYKVLKQDDRHAASSRIISLPNGIIASRAASYSSLGGHANRPSLPPQFTGSIRLSESRQELPPVPSSRSSIVRVQKSKRPIKLKRATPTKVPYQNKNQTLINNLADVRPFEKLAALGFILRTSLQGSDSVKDLRRLQLATTIHRNVSSSLAGQRLIRQDGLPQQNLILEIKDLGLGQLAIVMDQSSCSFCKFECNYGSSDPHILLPASASYQICTDCQPTSFFDEAFKNIKLPLISAPSSVFRQANSLPLAAQITPKYQMLTKLLSGDLLSVEIKLSDTVLDVKSQLSRSNNINWDLHHLVSGGAVLRNDRPLLQYRIGPKSLIEVVKLRRFNGLDVTQYTKPAFCSGCPWRQIDVKLANLCLICAEGRYGIINHFRHGAWIPFFNTVKEDDGTPVARYRQGNCMICTNLARMKCAGCPLLICVNCSTHLDGRCKGSLTTLIYSYGQEHIRNDAFLLRSDGAGF